MSENEIYEGRLLAWRLFLFRTNVSRYVHAHDYLREKSFGLYPITSFGSFDSPYSLLERNNYRDFCPSIHHVAPNRSCWNDESPSSSTHGGFWAFRTRKETLKYGGVFLQKRVPERHSNLLVALVSLSGEIVVHDNGYRSEFLEILELSSSFNASHRRWMAHKLGWPGKIHTLSYGRDSYPLPGRS